MGGICRRLVPECVLIGPQEQNKADLIRHLVGMLARVHKIKEPEQLVKDILEREQLGSTCIGCGCAIPHAHSITVDSTIIAAAQLDPPWDLDTPDGEPVSLLFLMAGPQKSAGLHIKLLSKLSRLLHDPDFRDELRNAKTPQEFHSAICREDD